MWPPPAPRLEAVWFLRTAHHNLGHSGTGEGETLPCQPWDMASTCTQHFLEGENTTAQLLLPKIVIKEIHSAGSQEHKPKITGLTLSQGVLIKHENQVISAEGAAKDRSDQIGNISSTQGWTARLEISFQREMGCAGAQLLQIHLSHVPNTSKKSCLWNALHCGAAGSHSSTAPRQTGFRVPLKRSSRANPSQGRCGRGQWKKLPIEGAKLDWHSNSPTVKENGKENLQVNDRTHRDK